MLPQAQHTIMQLGSDELARVDKNSEEVLPRYCYNDPMKLVRKHATTILQKGTLEPQIGLNEHQCTPFYLYIQNIKLV